MDACWCSSTFRKPVFLSVAPDVAAQGWINHIEMQELTAGRPTDRTGRDFLRWPRRHDATAILTRARTDIDEIARRGD